MGGRFDAFGLIVMAAPHPAGGEAALVDDQATDRFQNRRILGAAQQFPARSAEHAQGPVGTGQALLAFGDRFGHGIEGHGQATDFILAGHAAARREVARRQPVGACGEALGASQHHDLGHHPYQREARRQQQQHITQAQEKFFFQRLVGGAFGEAEKNAQLAIRSRHSGVGRRAQHAIRARHPQRAFGRSGNRGKQFRGTGVGFSDPVGVSGMARQNTALAVQHHQGGIGGNIHAGDETRQPFQIQGGESDGVNAPLGIFHG